jgi:hypothetical protein
MANPTAKTIYDLPGYGGQLADLYGGHQSGVRAAFT